MYYNGSLQEVIFAASITPARMYMFDHDLREGLSIIWNTGQVAKFVVDGHPYKLYKNSILFLTAFQTIDQYKFQSLNVIQFNRSFYCVEDHDSEIGCKGLLFFGAQETPIVKIGSKRKKHFQLLWDVLLMEIEEVDDSLKTEMLRNILRRFLILCIRIYKMSNFHHIKDSTHVGLIREYSYLVEKHYKQHTQVADYARLLFKSPKTLSNIFKSHISKTPLQIINERRLIEAKRLLRYSELHVQEIADNLSFSDIQAFSHFFKRHVNLSTTQFRTQQ